jgi:hypothetical protein
MTRWIAAGLLVVCGWLTIDHFVLGRPIRYGAGVVAAHVPQQRPLADEPRPFHKDRFRVVPLARFAMEARVIRAEHYCCTGPARLAPVDVVFGWGSMSDEAVLARLDISQSGRFYYWRYENEPPIPRREIETSSANMHLIPATDAIGKKLKALRSGNIVSLAGYLVEVTGEGGFQWRSSLTREDTGNGACELIWVEDLGVR